MKYRQNPLLRLLFPVNRNTFISAEAPGKRAWRKLKKDKLSMAALGMILLFSLVAILGYLITPDSSPFANHQMLEINTKKPGFKVLTLYVEKKDPPEPAGFFERMIHGETSAYEMIPVEHYKIENNHIIANEYTGDPGAPGREINIDLGHNQAFIKSKTFLLGTDRYGRDLLSQLMIGTRVSLSVGFISVLISLIVGIFIGAAGGYFRGWIDEVVVWVINVVWSIPTLLLVIAITFALGRGFWQVFIAVGLTMWVEVARVVRGQVLSIREKEYVEAARALGFGHLRIIYRHILPNVMSAVIVISAANFASAILLEAGLSFLGIGVQPPTPSWGSMIRENYGYIILDSAYLAILPGLAIMLMVLAFMLLGNGLRDALDVKLES